MIGKGEQTHPDRRYAAAVRKFPQCEFVIRRLMSRSETFCDMCEELADAEQALANVSSLEPELVSERQLEWQELVDRLVAEIKAAIDQTQSRQWHGIR